MSETRYVRSNDVFIAYRTLGEGPIDILWLFGGGIPMESMLQEPRIARFCERVASFSRVILHDRRGVGLSDPVSSWDETTLEIRAADANAVLDVVGSERAALVTSDLSGAHIGAMLASTYPKRVSALVMNNPVPRVFAAPDYPWGHPAGFMDVMTEAWKADIQEGTSKTLDLLIGPGRADEQLRNWWVQSVRRGMKLGQVNEAMRLVLGTDSRAILPAIQAPTLIVHDTEPAMWAYPEHARYSAEQIPNAITVQLPGSHMYVYATDTAELFINEIEEFITGVRRGPVTDRVLATVLFTDIVGSTELAASIGDHQWGQLLGRHNEITSRHVNQFHGKLIDRAGDGMLAMFDGPARAIRCAQALREALRRINIEIRAGLHSGEIELKEDEILGMAVHVGARVKDLAGPGEILTSGTVKDLVLGSGIPFENRGLHKLKGVPGEWQVFSAIEEGN